MAATHLVIENISLCYGEKPILDQVSFSLSRPGIHALLGVSGVGKSSLFHIMAGLTAPDQGAVLLDGENICSKPGQLSYMLQDDLLLEHKRVIDNVALPLKLAGEDKSRSQAQALELLSELGLQDTAKKWPCELSGGMRQRIAFLRTLMAKRQVMLLDESFSALDPKTRHELYQWFSKVVERFELQVLLITHDIDEALQLASKIWVLGRTSKQVGAHIQLELDTRFGNVDPKERLEPEFLLAPDVLCAKREILRVLRQE